MLRVKVRFEDQKSREALKRAGFRWNPHLQLWEGRDVPEHRQLLDQLGLRAEQTLLEITTQPSKGIARRDDKQMPHELMEGVLEEYIYDFVSKDGRRLVGISWAGAKRLAKTHLQGLDFELVRVDQSDRWISAIVKAKTEQASALGAAQMPVDNRFAYAMAVNKAQRNAILNLLDEALIKKALERYLEGGSSEEAFQLLEKGGV